MSGAGHWPFQRLTLRFGLSRRLSTRSWVKLRMASSGKSHSRLYPAVPPGSERAWQPGRWSGQAGTAEAVPSEGQTRASCFDSEPGSCPGQSSWPLTSSLASGSGSRTPPTPHVELHQFPPLVAAVHAQGTQVGDVGSRVLHGTGGEAGKGQVAAVR